MGAKGPPKEKSGALAVPKCTRTHTVELKLHNAPRGCPRGLGSTNGGQGRSCLERAPETP